MRIWDVAAGYLSRGSLLGEHRELHGLHAVVTHGRRGYSRHPETLRWVDALSGLAWRHAHLAAEMRLRGYVDRTPLAVDRAAAAWPSTFVTEPYAQIRLLRAKYVGREKGRIPLPASPQQLWAQHKYSVMARDPESYRRFGRVAAALRTSSGMDALTRDLVLLLREPPPPARLVNALEHMWGYVRRSAAADERRAVDGSPATLLAAIQQVAQRTREPYLLGSTALSELAVYARATRST